MTVYNINLGIGWASSGVEYAQAYRAELLRKANQPAKFVFMDLILSDNIQHLTSNIGFHDEEIIWLYSYFTDMKIAETSYRVDQVLAHFAGTPSREEKNGKVRRFFYEDQDAFVTCYLRAEESPYVERCEYVSRGVLVRKDYFSYGRYCSEYFRPKDGQANLVERRFYNEDGSVAYQMFVADGREIYRFKDHYLEGRKELIRYFMQELSLTEHDLVILDRATDIAQPIFQEVRPARLGVVVHAEHYSLNSVTEEYILWNNYYDYQFSNADKVDFFIVATERQKEVLREQFDRFTQHHPAIYTIPVGSLESLVHPQSGGRRPRAMLTASRLASEKHIDWLVHAVAKAHESLPDLTFDIYGKGGEEAKLVQLIEDLGAKDYIKLKGHANLSTIYPQYELYLSASTSEGFGLTLMEAIGSGLPIIGFDVPYGNQTFIREGQNGYLLPNSSDRVVDQIATAFAEKILTYYREEQEADFEAASYARAEEFLTDRVVKAWEQLIEEVTTC
ncbi:accessory Sec system glycosyltransferase GtfA [Streptococcus sp. DD13]|uniref:accessory Sec system glycosyltransferase GtfA n=1 Tax=Streptococcus sp. DD13 TaxID=1777881 RepID=UPI0007924BE6|nr:accessory Sec system glycosyltransferase GtfA [Streptococcus sp. DD13]KXT77739.1 Poly(glycerol-phosphate) alpha-glucosyltransferase GftA [Streptococcus sp. DD13]